MHDATHDPGRSAWLGEALLSLARIGELYGGDEQAAFRAVTEATARALDARRVSVCFLGDGDGDADLVCADRYDAATGAHLHGEAHEAAAFPRYVAALRAGDVIAAEDARADPRTAEIAAACLAPAGIAAVLHVPIRVGAAVRGVVCVDHAGGPRRWSLEEQGFAAAVAGCVSMAVEVAQRHGVQGELAEREREMAALLGNLPRTSFLYRHDTAGVFTFVSSSITDVLGYTAEEWCRHYTSYLTGDPVNREVVRHTEGTLRGEPQPPYEVSVYHRDGSERWLEVTEAPVRDGAGRVVGVTGIAVDVTGRKGAEQVLREHRARLDLALRSARMGVWQWDVGADRRAFDEQTCRLLGLDPGRFSGTAGEFFGAVHPDDRAAIRAALQRTLATDALYAPSYRAVWPDGSVHHLAARGRLLRGDDGRPARVVGIVWDESDARRAEEERLGLERRLLHAQKLESLGLLAGGIAHDFNNLLMAILGNVDLARAKLPADSPAREHLAQALLATRRSADLAGQMLAYSGRGSIALRPLDLGGLVAENSDLLLSAIPRNVRLEFLGTPGLPPVEADPAQLQQVVMNLIINAAEATGERGGVVTLGTGVGEFDAGYFAGCQAGEDAPPGRYVWLEVADTGAGMDRETLARVFDPFFTTKQLGRGLGMCALHGIVRGHGGAIRIESAPGRGTTARVLLRARSGGRVAPAPPAPAAAPALAGTVLVIDDEPLVLAVAGEMARQLGLRVLEAAGGAEALELVGTRGDELDCVLLDLTMPGLDGAAVFARLREQRPGLPVVLASGYQEEDAVRAVAGFRPAGFLKKPYSLETFRAALAAALAVP